MIVVLNGVHEHEHAHDQGDEVKASPSAITVHDMWPLILMYAMYPVGVEGCTQLLHRQVL